jgi:demethylmenaquinone methyltransferase/2-methoxy-6-polyprenyl-1,4-benzoquinol methylase
MANPFYQPGDARAAQVHALFSGIARRYDLLNDLQSLGLHRRWKRRVVELAAVGPGQRALDLCCGTGDLALALARGGGEVVGLDFNEAMLSVAGARLERAQRALAKQSKTGNAQCSMLQAAPSGSEALTTLRPTFLRGDALRIPFPDSHFDAVTIGYGLRNLSSWETGVREMMRVAKPGGRLVILDFGKPANAAWRALYFSYLRLVVPLLGRLICGDAQAYAYILESLRHYPAQLGLADALRTLGLRDVRIINFLGGAMSINFAIRP